MIIFVYGGSRSGKSEFAEAKISELSSEGSRYYIATMIARGSEGLQRVERHRSLRADKHFKTIECPMDIARALDEIRDPDKAAVLLECVSNLCANEMFESADGPFNAAERIKEGLYRLISGVKNLVIVSVDLFADGAEYSDDVIAYMRCLGDVNRYIASLADQVYEVSYGIPVKIKSCAEKTCKAFGISEKKREKELIRLVAGGFAQGKLEYVMASLEAENKKCFVVEGSDFSSEDELFDPEMIISLAGDNSVVALNDLHRIIRLFEGRANARKWIWSVADACEKAEKQLVLICCEVGSGIIPMEYNDRVYRENVGRIMSDLAKRADIVERVICGVSCRLK